MVSAPFSKRKPAYLRRLAKRRASQYGAEQPPAPVPAGPRACSTRREGDEMVCHCGLRWDAQEDRPGCPHQGSY